MFVINRFKMASKPQRGDIIENCVVSITQNNNVTPSGFKKNVEI